MASSSKADLTPMEELLGPELFTATKKKGGDVGEFTKKSTKKIFENKDYVLLYFSASWCPPCKAFSPVLADFYKQHAKSQKIEIVYVSSDRSLEEFDGYYGKMPWMAVPTDAASAQIKNALSTRLSIRGIPSLIVVQVSTGLFVTSKAREQIQNLAPNKFDKAAVETVVEYWKSTPAVTLEEGAAADNAFQMPTLYGLVMAVLKNPIYIFGMIYMFKQAMRYYKNWVKTNGGDDATAPLMGDVGDDGAGAGNSEF